MIPLKEIGLISWFIIHNIIFYDIFMPIKQIESMTEQII